MQPHYVTVYQISADAGAASFAVGLKIVTIIFAAIGLAAGVCLFFYWKFTHRKNREIRWLLRIPYFVFSCFFVICGFALIVAHNLARHSQDADTGAVRALQNGDFQTVEGTVTHFDPMPYEGHKMECFSVQGERFCYSDYFIAPGFRNTASHGGPIRPGLKVRIDYKSIAKRNAILRIDIARD
jgi:hypothetical protein